MRGKLEHIRKGVVTGWLWDERTPEAHVEFDLLVNDVPVGTFVADQVRKDLQKNGIGAGDHCFRVPLQPHWLNDGSNVVTIATDPPLASISDALQFRGKFPEDEDIERIRAAQQPQRRPTSARTTSVQPITSILKKRRTPSLPAMLVAPSSARPRRPGEKGAENIATQHVQSLLARFIAVGEMKEPQIATITEALFKQNRFDEIILIAQAAGSMVAKSYRVLNHVGRAYLNTGRVEEAVATLERLRAVEPKRHGAIYFLGVALAKLQRMQDSYEVMSYCLSFKDDEAKYHLEAGRAANALAFGGYGVSDHDERFIPIALDHLKKAADLDTKDFRALREMAPLYIHLGDAASAYKAAKDAVARKPDAAVTWQTLSTTCVRLNRFDEAEDAIGEALKLAPDSDAAKFGARILQRFRQPRDGVRPTSLAFVTPERASEIGDDIEQLATHLAELDAEWIAIARGEAFQGFEALIEGRGFQWAAGIATSPDASPNQIIWRRSFLLRLLNANVVAPTDGVEGLLEVAAANGAIVRSPEDEIAERPARPVAILLSQYGIHKFGGAEQFLEQMAHLYSQMGFDVLLVGTRSEFIGQSGQRGDLRYTFVESDPDELFRLAVEEHARIVHVVSGLGFEVAVATRHLDTRLVFGIHFWRELFYNPTPSAGYYPDVDRSQLPRPEFSIVLDDFSAIYSNSVYSRQLVEKHFGIRTPIIYSLPDDWVDPEPVPLEERRGVLLANARVDKGFGLLLDTAALLPDVPFTAIASQSGRAAAEDEVARRKLSNVTILSRVDDMVALYRTVRAALVPSFRFVETFSRVVIEAHRLGLPVIGSDRGNVPMLLTQSGVALPEDPAAWAAEIGRLCHDDEYWQSRSALATENSARYGFAQQRERLERLISATDSPILVGVGSGLGNVLHTTPLIRNLAIRLGRRVDVVVAGDYADLLCCVSHQSYVNHVFMLGSEVLNRRYDTVFLTHSFGGFVPQFSARRVFASRDWDNFRADHHLHEAEFNLAAAEAQLGVSYEESDVKGYFFGDLTYDPPKKLLIGFHGGSKGGVWATKRWPHYEKLAERLKKMGYDVASFGTADEYVPGTIDMTGGSIEEMARAMLACSHFVANDSGVMNVANALGIPLVALFAPTNAATRGPLHNKSVSISVEKSCSPCEMHLRQGEPHFRSGMCACIAEITVDQVISGLAEIGIAKPTVLRKKPKKEVAI